jgi:transposase-like protein
MPIKRYQKEVNKKKTDVAQARWSEKQKFEAVALYKLIGSLAEVARQLGVPIITVKVWHRQPWWKEYEQEIAHAAKTELTGKMKTIANKAMTVVEDRLDNGDWVFIPKTGEIKRKPISAHVANKILNDSVDRQFMIEKLQREQIDDSNKDIINTRLQQLHQEFAKFAKAKTIEGEVAVKGGDPISQASPPAQVVIQGDTQ